jgi:hypothetical protein
MTSSTIGVAYSTRYFVKCLTCQHPFYLPEDTHMKYWWLVAGAVLFTLVYYFNITISGAYFTSACIIGIIVIHEIEQSKLARKIESLRDQLQDLQKKTEPMTDPKKQSYKLDVMILPNWDNILDRLAMDNKKSRDELLEMMKGNGELNPSGWGLCYKGFRFVMFKDNVSGVCQFWSDQLKTFVDEMEIIGWIFEKGQLNYKMSESLHHKWIFSPSKMGIENIYGGESIGEELGRMPFWDIVRFLMEFDRRLGAMCAIKKFPKDLQTKLDETGTKYPIEDSGLWILDEFDKEDAVIGGCDGWAEQNGVQAYSQEVPFHEFENTFYGLQIKLETFSQG